jgi:hypothetical protein
MPRTVALLAASLVLITSAQTAVKPKDSPATLERRLLGEWKGGACQGDWTFRADGTCELKHYSPGNDTLTGTWGIRWNALPPTLNVTFNASDNSKYVGTKWELRIIQLDDEALVYQHADGVKTRYERVKK